MHDVMLKNKEEEMIVAMITRSKHLLFLVPDDYSPKLLQLVAAFFSGGD